MIYLIYKTTKNLKHNTFIIKLDENVSNDIK